MMKISSDIKEIRKASAEVENFLKANNIDKSSVFDIRLCVEEAVKNAIIHGNKKNKNTPVFIQYSLDGDKFKMEVEDKGNGFNPDELPDPTLDENLLREGGRGVFLIHKLMDEVKYSNNGNKVLMIKFVKKNKGGNNAV